MKVVDASKLNRKSGVRCCERGAPVQGVRVVFTLVVSDAIY
jgi:hypothetical protein